jgi:hypothetical protein
MHWDRGGLFACWPGIKVMLAEIADALEHGCSEGRDPSGVEIARRTGTGHLAVFTADGTLAGLPGGSGQDPASGDKGRAWIRGQR